jgi:Arc/MetJ-type ribon-helix-helix transcriptional regulator
MEIINVKVEKETKEHLETLVKKKAYGSLSEAVRQIINDHLNEHPELFASGMEIESLIDKANKMSDRRFEELVAKALKGRKSAAEIVRDSRGGA